jgi:HEAT repeat protein
MTSLDTTPSTPELRTPPEATALLVELGRALRGRTFYEIGSPQLRAVLSRAIRFWLADLQRSGAIEVTVTPAGLRLPVLGHQVPKLQVGGLTERLSERGVRSVRFAETVDGDAMAAFIELLAAAPGLPEREGGFARALYASVPDGIVINEEPPSSATDPPPRARGGEPGRGETATEPIPAPEEIEPGPEIPAEEFDDASRDVSSFDFRIGELRADHTTGGAEGPALDYSISDASLELETDEEALAEPASPEDGEATSIELLQAPTPPPAEIPPRAEPPREDTDTDVLRELPREDTDTTPALDPEGDGRWQQLRGLLRELEVCEEDFKYNDLARRAGSLAASLSDEGRSEAGIRAVRLFVQHSGDTAKCSPRQREIATEQLERLVNGSRLEDLIQLCFGSDPTAALDASQLLLATGRPVVGPLVRMAVRERDPERRSRLQSMLIAMGDLLLPELMRALDAEDASELRSAVRLAGESQNPAAVDRLEELLMHPDGPLRQETAKALARIGDARSTEALARALGSPLEGVPASAAYCLGSAGSGRAVEALLSALHSALEDSEFGFAAEVIRSLGRLGRPEATDDLAAVLLHRGVRKRRQYRELKLAAASSLGRIPGDAAAGALAQAAQVRDAQLRRAAQTALDRRRSQLQD